jgi:hypothetical protein
MHTNRCIATLGSVACLFLSIGTSSGATNLTEQLECRFVLSFLQQGNELRPTPNSARLLLYVSNTSGSDAEIPSGYLMQHSVELLDVSGRRMARLLPQRRDEGDLGELIILRAGASCVFSVAFPSDAEPFGDEIPGTYFITIPRLTTTRYCVEFTGGLVVRSADRTSDGN